MIRVLANCLQVNHLQKPSGASNRQICCIHVSRYDIIKSWSQTFIRKLSNGYSYGNENAASKYNFAVSHACILRLTYLNQVVQYEEVGHKLE